MRLVPTWEKVGGKVHNGGALAIAGLLGVRIGGSAITENPVRSPHFEAPGDEAVLAGTASLLKPNVPRQPGSRGKKTLAAGRRFHEEPW